MRTRPDIAVYRPGNPLIGIGCYDHVPAFVPLADTGVRFPDVVQRVLPVDEGAESAGLNQASQDRQLGRSHSRDWTNISQHVEPQAVAPHNRFAAARARGCRRISPVVLRRRRPLPEAP